MCPEYRYSCISGCALDWVLTGKPQMWMKPREAL
jgi:hypothetical protein